LKFKFPHKEPSGYHYETEEYKRNVIRIVLHCDRKFDYNLGKPTKTIWGFFNSKTGKFYRPINYKDMGKEITDLKSTTTPYTGMKPPQKTILEQCFM
jgi:hypothetical protein